MMRSFLGLTSVLFVAVLLVGCVSAPVKKSSEDCLVLIPTYVINESGQPFARQYYLQVEGVDGVKELLVSDFRATYLLALTHGPGAKITGIRTTVDKSRGFTGPDQTLKYELELPYVPGRLVASETSFALKMVRITSESYSSNIVPLPSIDADTAELVAKFQANEANASWFKD